MAAGFDSDLTELCDALAEVASVLGRRPELLDTVASVGTAAFTYAAVAASEGRDPAAEVLRVLAADDVVDAGLDSIAPPAPDTVKDATGEVP